MATLPVSQLMQPCASATITLTTPLREAAERVLTTGLATLPVADALGHFAGIVAESALIRSLMTQSSSRATVATIVSHHVQSARTEAELASVLPLFRSAGHTTIPVVDANNVIVGLLHRQDVIRFLLRSESPASNDAEPEKTIEGPHFKRKQQRGSNRPQ